MKNKTGMNKMSLNKISIIENRKGDVFEIGSMIWRFVFIMIAVFLVYFLIKSHISTKVEVQNLEMEIFIQRMIYAKNGISYYDDALDRGYPGKIKLENFNQEYFSKNVEPAIYFGRENRLIGAKFALLEKDGRKITPPGEEVKYNRNFYNEKERLYLSKNSRLLGKGGVTGKEVNVPVTIMENGGERPGMLNIAVIMQNV